MQTFSIMDLDQPITSTVFNEIKVRAMSGEEIPKRLLVRAMAWAEEKINELEWRVDRVTDAIESRYDPA